MSGLRVESRFRAFKEDVDGGSGFDGEMRLKRHVSEFGTPDSEDRLLRLVRIPHSLTWRFNLISPSNPLPPSTSSLKARKRDSTHKPLICAVFVNPRRFQMPPCPCGAHANTSGPFPILQKRSSRKSAFCPPTWRAPSN